MAKKLDDIMATLPAQRRARIEGRTMKLVTPKVVRKVVEASRKDLSAVFDVVPNAISSSKERWHSYFCLPPYPLTKAANARHLAAFFFSPRTHLRSVRRARRVLLRPQPAIAITTADSSTAADTDCWGWSSSLPW